MLLPYGVRDWFRASLLVMESRCRARRVEVYQLAKWLTVSANIKQMCAVYATVEVGALQMMGVGWRKK
jgi:hypothetical protein